MRWDGWMLRRRRLRRFAAGAFSLPELMIALAILGLGLLIIAAALPAGLQYTSDTSAQVTGDAVSKYATDELGQRLRTSSKLGDSKATLRMGNPSDPDYWVPLPGRRRDPIVRPRISIAVSGSSLIDDTDAHLQARLGLAPVDPDAPMPANAARPFDLATIPSAIGGTDANVFADWEPIIKFRPFVGLNLDPTAAYNANTPQQYAQYNQVVENSEEQIRGWLLDMESITFTSGISYLRRDVHKLLTDVDVWPVDRTGSQDRWGGTGVGRFSLRTNPALSPTMRAFPPAENATRYQVAKYFQDLQNASLRQQRLPWLPATDSLIGPDYSFIDPTEIRRLLDTRYSWTAFYRRVSYAPGSDSSLYEIMVVVTRRPSAAHYYLAADTTNTNLAMPPINTLNLAAGGSPRARLFPEPWLVTFIPGPQGYFYEPHLTRQHFPIDDQNNMIITPDRNLRADVAPPDRLTFYATPNVARLLPKGSYFFPATNDESSRGSSSSQIAEFTGFAPRAAADQPLYQVVDQIPNAFNDAVGIVVTFNGFYPWVKSSNATDPLAADANQPRCWPVWVIPPAVAAGTLERKSPIVTILRETVRIPEIRN